MKWKPKEIPETTGPADFNEIFLRVINYFYQSN